jgi:phosphopantothenoylcysteine decarboxylase/phosphopantothenate--cysteine ligase
LMQTRRPGQVALGFAALSGESSALLEQARSKRQAKGCDLLFANPVDRPGQGFGAVNNGGWLLLPKDRVEELPVTSKLRLAHQLLDSLIQAAIEAES